MSAIVGVWMDEIEKLKAQAQAQAQARGALLWRAKKEQSSAKERRVEEEEEEASKETTMSETTLCLLMDRFGSRTNHARTGPLSNKAPAAAVSAPGNLPSLCLTLLTLTFPIEGGKAS
ncbi:hypothetical protein V6N13_018292 [Hibiscus sabdariffa]|uniref:Remorin C-terminal domain-containing protein n=1 Tax=Hibiscus sabdariffa TaxID=183260 RepID=A0ABR2EME8_9ROSI